MIVLSEGLVGLSQTHISFCSRAVSELRLRTGLIVSTSRSGGTATCFRAGPFHASAPDTNKLPDQPMPMLKTSATPQVFKETAENEGKTPLANSTTRQETKLSVDPSRIPFVPTARATVRMAAAGTSAEAQFWLRHTS